MNTTVGRVILNDHLPEGMPFINGLLKKKGIGQLVTTATCTSAWKSRSRCWTR